MEREHRGEIHICWSLTSVSQEKKVATESSQKDFALQNFYRKLKLGLFSIWPIRSIVRALRDSDE